jgi:broad specificity phosphatase PhoE
MSTRILLIRHASVDAIGKWLAGCAAGHSLNEQGKMEAQQLAARLTTIDLSAIYCSPLERAQETASAVAAQKQLQLITCNHLTDIDFGDWTGKTFSELYQNPEWHSFNQQRSTMRIPGGESMLDVVQRMLRTLDLIRDRHSDSNVAVFSHCDPIRAVITHCAGISLDLMQRISIDPASVSVLELYSHGAQILTVNNRSDCGYFA